jgi:hypothetical protein
MKDNLGKTGIDRVTGYTGMIVSYLQNITSADQYALLGKASDNKVPDMVWLDCERIEVTEVQPVGFKPHHS